MKMTTHYPNKYERQAKKLLPESDCLTLIKGSSCPENVIELVALCLTLFPLAWCSSEGCQVAFQYVENSQVFSWCFMLSYCLFGKSEIVPIEYLSVYHR